MKKIIIDDAIPYAKEMFSTLGEITCLPGKEINASHVKKADALIIRSRTNINSSLLNNSSVNFVGSTVVGLDHIDQDYLSQKKINFYSAQGCNANSVAEFVITCIINHAEENNIQLNKKTLGIIGIGNVGKRLHKKANALGLTILANDPPRQEKDNLLNFVTLEQALTADFVSFHTPLTTEGEFPTTNLLNKNNFAFIKKNALIINAARGGVIEESAWINYAQQNPSLTSIVDCWENEPNVNSKLADISALSTPHIAGHALEAKIKGSQMVYQALCKHWQEQESNHWQSYLIEKPIALKLTHSSSSQKIIQQLLKQCYQPTNDHQAIKITNPLAFEHYRRHYPIRREWTEYNVYASKHDKLNQTIKALGFGLI